MDVLPSQQADIPTPSVNSQQVDFREAYRYINRNTKIYR